MSMLRLAFAGMLTLPSGYRLPIQEFGMPENLFLRCRNFITSETVVPLQLPAGFQIRDIAALELDALKATWDRVNLYAQMELCNLIRKVRKMQKSTHALYDLQYQITDFNIKHGRNLVTFFETYEHQMKMLAACEPMFAVLMKRPSFLMMCETVPKLRKILDFAPDLLKPIKFGNDAADRFFEYLDWRVNFVKPLHESDNPGILYHRVPSVGELGSRGRDPTRVDNRLHQEMLYFPQDLMLYEKGNMTDRDTAAMAFRAYVCTLFAPDERTREISWKTFRKFATQVTTCKIIYSYLTTEAVDKKILEDLSKIWNSDAILPKNSELLRRIRLKSLSGDMRNAHTDYNRLTYRWNEKWTKTIEEEFKNNCQKIQELDKLEEEELLQFFITTPKLQSDEELRLLIEFPPPSTNFKNTKHEMEAVMFLMRLITHRIIQAPQMHLESLYHRCWEALHAGQLLSARTCKSSGFFNDMEILPNDEFNEKWLPIARRVIRDSDKGAEFSFDHIIKQTKQICQERLRIQKERLKGMGRREEKHHTIWFSQV